MRDSQNSSLEKQLELLLLTRVVETMLAFEAMSRFVFLLWVAAHIHLLTYCSFSWCGLKPPRSLSVLLCPFLIGQTPDLLQIFQFPYLASDLCEKMQQSLSHTVASFRQKIFLLCRESALISCGSSVHTQDLQGTAVFVFCRNLVRTISVPKWFYFCNLGSTLRQSI